MNLLALPFPQFSALVLGALAGIVVAIGLAGEAISKWREVWYR